MDPQSHRLGWWGLKVACGAALIALVVDRFLVGLVPIPAAPPVVLGQMITGLGAVIVVFHYACIKRANPNPATPERLVTHRGLFRWIRHPVYLGDLFVFAGLALLAPSVVALACLLVGGWAVRAQAQVEDRYVAQRFGAGHQAWRRHTGLLVPRIG